MAILIKKFSHTSWVIRGLNGNLNIAFGMSLSKLNTVMLFFFIYEYHRTFKFLCLLFECGFENITVDRTRYSLKEQKKIRLLVVMYTLMGFQDWQLDLGCVFAATVLRISLVEDCGKW